MSPDNQKGLSRSNAVLRLNRSGTDAGDRPGNIAGTERQVLETGTSKQREKKACNETNCVLESTIRQRGGVKTGI